MPTIVPPTIFLVKKNKTLGDELVTLSVFHDRHRLLAAIPTNSRCRSRLVAHTDLKVGGVSIDGEQFTPHFARGRQLTLSAGFRRERNVGAARVPHAYGSAPE